MMSKWWRTAGGTLKWAALGIPKERSYHTIQAIPRVAMPAKERAQGRIPTVVFSETYIQKIPGAPITLVAYSNLSRKYILTTEKRQIKSILESVGLRFFLSTTFLLQVRSKSGSSVLVDSGKVLPRKVHTDEKGEILKLVFAWAEDGTELKVDVPVVYKGEDVCPGIRNGGRLKRVTKAIRYLCPAEHIPPKIEVDVSNLDIGDKVLISDLQVHPTMKPVSIYTETPVCQIEIRRTLEPKQPKRSQKRMKIRRPTD